MMVRIWMYSSQAAGSQPASQPLQSSDILHICTMNHHHHHHHHHCMILHLDQKSQATSSVIGVLGQRRRKPKEANEPSACYAWPSCKILCVSLWSTHVDRYIKLDYLTTSIGQSINTSWNILGDGVNLQQSIMQSPLPRR